MDKKILVSMMVIGLVATLAGAGLHAYFWDTGTSTGNTFSAGTLDLKLSDSDEGWADGVTATWSSPSNWAPGEEVVAWLNMSNSGSIGVKLVSVHGENLGGTGLADVVLLTMINYTEGGQDLYGNLIGYYATTAGMDADGDGNVTLSEFISWSQTYSMVFWKGNWGGTEDYLKPNSANEEMLVLGFTFAPWAGNYFQGRTASFDLVVRAYQSWAQYTLAGKGAGCHGYGS